MEGRRNKVVMYQAVQDQYLKIYQGSMTLMEYYNEVQSKLAAVERAEAKTVAPCIVEEIAAANGHDAPTEADILEAYNYDVAVRFVMQSNYRNYIAELRNDYLDNKNNYPRTLASAYEIMRLRGPESSRPEH